MAMLAEPRKRYKWIYNPRGMDWVNDDNKYGQKLMEKMGWSKGKGLGKEEQGNVDHVEVHVKNDSKGIGYKVTDDAWVKHYEGFEIVLAALNRETSSSCASHCSSASNSNLNSDDEESKVTSLEALSKSSQARVHYHKFARGKDLSLLNSDDIACITGSKRAKRLAQIAQGDDFQEDEIGHAQQNGGLTTIKGGNIQDYFSKKWAAIKGETPQHQDALEANVQTKLRESAGDEFDFCVKKKEKRRKRKVKIDDIQKHPDMLLPEYKEEKTSKKARNAADNEKNEDAEGKNNMGPDKLGNDDSKTEASLKEQQQKNKKKKLSIFEDNENGKKITRISPNSEALPKKKKKSNKICREKVMEAEPSDESACFVEENEKKLKEQTTRVYTEEYEDEEMKTSSLYSEEALKKKKKRKISLVEKGIETESAGENACSVYENGAMSDTKKDDGYFELDINVNGPDKKKKKKYRLKLEKTEDDNKNTVAELNVIELEQKKRKKGKK